MGDQTNSFSHPSALLIEKGQKGQRQLDIETKRQRITFYDVL